MLSKFLRSRRRAPAPGGVLPAGTRVYAIGDIHGRLDLLDAILAKIDADDAARAPAETVLIFLGDLVDRGPDSAGVVERVRALQAERANVHVLMGNHEEVLLASLDGDSRALRLFCRIGGRETMLSYGLAEADYDGMDYTQLADWLAGAIPAEHRAYLESLEDMIVLGDYAFVHAGIDPAVELAAQRVTDLRWIRETFLDHRGALERIVVHGHTITDDVAYRSNRIGIDTGAYRSGRLTALGLEEGAVWEMTT